LSFAFFIELLPDRRVVKQTAAAFAVDESTHTQKKDLMKKVLVAMFVVAGFAFAEDLKPAQEEGKEAFEKETADSLKALNEKCGTKATITADFANFDAEKWSGVSYPSYCRDVVDAVAEMCSSKPAYKKVIAKKLTQVACLFKGAKPAQKDDGSNGATLRNMSFNKGVFTLFLDKDTNANLGENVRTTLTKALN
jgi:hypothetical protein